MDRITCAEPVCHFTHGCPKTQCDPLLFDAPLRHIMTPPTKTCVTVTVPSQTLLFVAPAPTHPSRRPQPMDSNRTTSNQNPNLDRPNQTQLAHTQSISTGWTSRYYRMTGSENTLVKPTHFMNQCKKDSSTAPTARGQPSHTTGNIS